MNLLIMVSLHGIGPCHAMVVWLAARRAGVNDDTLAHPARYLQAELAVTERAP